MSPREELIRWLQDAAWSRGETATLGDRLGSMTFHYGGSARSLDGNDLRQLIDRWREGFPDLSFEIEDLLEQGDRIAARLRLRGTHRGPWRGMPPTGRAMDIDVMMFFRFDGDALVEIWEVDDATRRDHQLGVGAPAAPSPPLE